MFRSKSKLASGSVVIMDGSVSTCDQRFQRRTVSVPSTNYSGDTRELIHQKLRILESENRRLMANQGKLIQETNRKIQIHLNQIRMLKEEVEGLHRENAELRDLCCFLDDDRQRRKRLSREWQRFGHYSSNVLRQEVTAYQEKAKQLETLQKEIVEENSELKQLCLYLNQQRKPLGGSKCPGWPADFGISGNLSSSAGRLGPGGSGDDGEESSERSSDSELPFPALNSGQFMEISPFLSQMRCEKNSTNTNCELTQSFVPSTEIGCQNCEGTEQERKTQLTNESTLVWYIRALEARVEQLETNHNHNLLVKGSLVDPNNSTSSPDLPSDPELVLTGYPDSPLNHNNDPLLAAKQSSGRSVGTSVTYGSSGSESPITPLFLSDQKLNEQPEKNTPGYHGDSVLVESNGSNGLAPIDENDQLEVDLICENQSLSNVLMQSLSLSESPMDGSVGKVDGGLDTVHFPRSLIESARLSYSEPTSLNRNKPTELTSTSFAGPRPLVRHWSMIASRKDGSLLQHPHAQCSVGAQRKSLSQALKVLEIAENINSTENKLLDQTEKAIIQQMCSVVWKTIDNNQRNGERRNSGNSLSKLTTTVL